MKISWQPSKTSPFLFPAFHFAIFIVWQLSTYLISLIFSTPKNFIIDLFSFIYLAFFIVHFIQILIYLFTKNFMRATKYFGCVTVIILLMVGYFFSPLYFIVKQTQYIVDTQNATRPLDNYSKDQKIISERCQADILQHCNPYKEDFEQVFFCLGQSPQKEYVSKDCLSSLERYIVFPPIKSPRKMNGFYLPVGSRITRYYGSANEASTSEAIPYRGVRCKKGKIHFETPYPRKNPFAMDEETYISSCVPEGQGFLTIDKSKVFNAPE